MTLAKIDHETAVNLDAVAWIKFSQASGERSAVVKFLNPAPGAEGFTSEEFSGEAAENLYRIINNDEGEELPPAEAMPILHSGFVRTKAWYYLRGADRRGYFIAFVNAKGSCSMRTFDAESGRFVSKNYRAGNYQEQFSDVIQNATELTIGSQPNLERNCKERLPDSVLSHLKAQVK